MYIIKKGGGLIAGEAGCGDAWVGEGKRGTGKAAI